jgi:hypothetical protein
MHMMRLGCHWRTAASLLDRNARLFGRIEPGGRFVEIGDCAHGGGHVPGRVGVHPLAVAHEP